MNNISRLKRLEEILSPKTGALIICGTNSEGKEIFLKETKIEGKKKIKVIFGRGIVYKEDKTTRSGLL